MQHALLLGPTTNYFDKLFPVEKRLPWGVILLLGGGFALADATKKTGLSKYIGHQLVALKDIPIRWEPTSEMSSRASSAWSLNRLSNYIGSVDHN